MGAQEITGKIFNSRTLPKPVIPDSISSSNHINGGAASPFNLPASSHVFSNLPSSSNPLRQDGSLELPKVKREPSPDTVSDPLHRSSQLSLAPLRPNGSSPTLLGLASVCSSRSPLPSTDSLGRPVKSRPFSPPPSPYPQRRTSTSSGETMDHYRLSNTAYSSSRVGAANRDYDHRDRRTATHGLSYDPISTRDRSGSGTSVSGLSTSPHNHSANVRPMNVDAPSPGLQASVPSTSRPQTTNSTDRLLAQFRPRGAPYPPISREHTSLSNHNSSPNLNVPSYTHYSQKRPSPSNAGESEKEDMDEDDPRRQLDSLSSKDDDSFTSHREKRRVIEKKSRMRRVDALDHLRMVVSREFQYQHQRGHGTHSTHESGGLSALHNIDPLTQAPRKNCQADICFEAVEIIEKLRHENDRLKHQNRDLIERLRQTNPHGSPTQSGSSNGRAG